ncbi:MAG: CIA30 family protein [Verrucomicrobiae bacterium]|nr:CIA30 family protein [Verrucomicrobiae bacterium]
MNPFATSRMFGAAYAVLGMGIASSDTLLAQSESKPGSWRGQSITEFTPEENARMDWRVVNDGVMGGLSEGNVDFTEAGTMKFQGKLSLENNGGFTTARSGDVDLNLSNDLGLLLMVKGDGRTYEARLDSDAKFRGNAVSFAGQIPTTKGQWQQVKIPFSEFRGSFRGTDLPDAVLNPAAIKRVWILLGDKKQGSFDLEVDWIRTYGKGQGNFTEQKETTEVSVAKAEVVKKAEKKSASFKDNSLIATAVADGRFTILKQALDAAGLTTFFQWDDPLTVFAPTDEAFAKLPDGVLEDLLRPENKQKLIALLSYHVSTGANGLGDALKAKEVSTIEGSPVEFSFSDGKVRVNGAALIDADVQCSDGVIHVIDSVLVPSQLEIKTVLSFISAAD